ncbi:hypothetical protein L6248_00195 [Candidatus Parcubacteria bacterium]|nr:hypothetical protein [Candidatus Parcubacteria bacterium]
MAGTQKEKTAININFIFTPLNKAADPIRYLPRLDIKLSNKADEAGNNKLAAVGGLRPPAKDAYLTGFMFSILQNQPLALNKGLNKLS